MITVGFRVEPGAIYFAVVEGTKAKAVVVEENKMQAPKTFIEEGEQLVWYRKRILDLLERHKIGCAGIRLTEGVARSMSEKRVRIEGVVMEAVSSKPVPIRAAGGLQHIRARLGSDHSPKDYLSGAVELRGISLSDYPKNTQEAILVAVASLSEK